MSSDHSLSHPRVPANSMRRSTRYGANLTSVKRARIAERRFLIPSRNVIVSFEFDHCGASFHSNFFFENLLCGKEQQGDNIVQVLPCLYYCLNDGNQRSRNKASNKKVKVESGIS
jgi:hypothetical protein